MHERETKYQDNATAFSVMVRVGTVTAVDNDKRLAQVYFEEMDLTSGWLPVLINQDSIPDYEVQQETEEAAGHKHELKIKPWMPQLDDQVLCMYEPIRDGRGFVLGGIRTWQ